MREFECFVKNEEYAVGCTGQTVYLYDRYGAELAKFKDLRYAYNAAFSPKGDIFVVRSNEGRLAVYSLPERRLLLKFRYAKLDSQDGNLCFSPDGEKLYILVNSRDNNSSVSVYNTADWSLEARLFENEHCLLKYIEYNSDADGYFLLGQDDDARYFTARMCGGEICDIEYITESEYDFYLMYKPFEESGFVSVSLRLVYPLDEIKDKTHSLAGLWQHYHSKREAPDTAEKN